MTDGRVNSSCTLKFCCDILSSSSMIYRVCEDDDSKLRAQDIKAIIDLQHSMSDISSKLAIMCYGYITLKSIYSVSICMGK